MKSLSRYFLLIALITTIFSLSIVTNAANPGSPILPSDNIQDPGALTTPWGGCVPTDSNCYVTTNSSQWVTNGSDIYYNTGKVGVGIRTPNGQFQVAELQYSTGTASQSGTTITGVGTSWSVAVVGNEFVFADGSKAMIIGRSSNTSLTVDISQTVASQTYGIYYTGLSVNSFTGDVSIGSIRNPNSNSRLFVYGGNTGANIDARGLSGQYMDISQFEAEGNDYDTLPNSLSIRYFGSTASGSSTLMGYDSNKLGVLDFLNTTTSLIRSNTSIQFGGGASDLVTMTLDPNNRRLGIGTTTPTVALDVVGDTKISTLAGGGTQCVQVDNAGLLFAAACGGGGTPSLTATQIAFGDGSNLMTSSSDLVYDATGYFGVLFGGNEFLKVAPNEAEYILGDVNVTNNGNHFGIFDTTNSAFYRNSTNTGKFGINTSNPDAAFHVQGQSGLFNFFKIVDTSNYSGIQFISHDYSNVSGTATMTVNPQNGFEMVTQDTAFTNQTSFRVLGDGAGIYMQQGGNRFDINANGNYFSGNVGVNTSTPSVALDVVGDVLITQTGSSSFFQTDIANGLFNLFGSSTASVSIDGSNGEIGIATNNFVLDNASHNAVFGINNSNPSVALDVVGDGIFNGAVNIYNGSSLSLQVYGKTIFEGPEQPDAFVVNADGDNYITIDASSSGIYFNSAPVHIESLSGTGTRAVVADASGVLSAPISDRSVKENIQPLTGGLDTLMQLNPVTFYFKEGWKNYGTNQQIGFIAQDIAQVLPNSAFTTPQTGKMGYNEIDLVPVAIKAVQEMNIKMIGLADVTTPNTWRDSLVSWFGSMNNNISTFIANKIKAKDQICINDTCINENQLKQILQNQNSAPVVTPASQDKPGQGTDLGNDQAPPQEDSNQPHSEEQ